MRVATLLLCCGLSACAGGKLPGEQPAPAAIRSGVASGAGGGASTAARSAATEPPGPDRLTQARADCWMKVEREKGARDLDRRIAFVDKCVAGQMKAKP